MGDKARYTRRRRTSWIKSALWWVRWTAAAVVLYLAARSRANAWRGYEAVGGELLILGLPMYIHSVLPTLRDWARDIREAMHG